MSDEIPIDEITKNIIEQIKKEDNTSTDNDALDIDKSDDDNNFEKLVQLEKLEKLEKSEKKKNSIKKKLSENIHDNYINNYISKDSNFKNFLKEASLIFLLFIILNHTSCNSLLDNIPLQIINENNFLQLMIKAIIMIIFFYFFKFLLN